MAQRTELVYLEEEDAYVSQTRVSMPLYKENGQKRRGEERTFLTREISSVQLTSESRIWMRVLGVFVLILAVASGLLGLLVLAGGSLGLCLFFLVFGALLAAPIIVWRARLFGRMYFAMIYMHGSSWYSGRRTRERAQVRDFVGAVGKALSSRDYGPGG